MSNPIRICIIAPVNTNAYNKKLLAGVQPVLPPDVTVEIRNLDRGHNCIENRVDWLQNGYPVVELARKIEKEGFDGIWLSDFDMCGVEAAREAINIPIIGGFPACVFTALGLCQNFSIVTILDSTLAMQKEHVLTYGQLDNFASIHAINVPVAELDNVDVVSIKVFEAASIAIKEHGAQSILLGCTGFVGVAEKSAELLQEAFQTYIPVIDPNQAGFSFLVSLIRQKLRVSRLCYSKVDRNNNNA